MDSFRVLVERQPRQLSWGSPNIGSDAVFALPIVWAVDTGRERITIDQDVAYRARNARSLIGPVRYVKDRMASSSDIS